MSHSIESYQSIVASSAKKVRSARRASSEGRYRAYFSTSDHMRAVLNQVKFGWSLQISPSFDRSAPIYFMGKCYNTKNDDIQSSSSSDGTLANFMDDFASRLWFTYREDFTPLCFNGDFQVLNGRECGLSSTKVASPGSSYQECSATSDGVFEESQLGVLVDIPPHSESTSMQANGKVPEFEPKSVSEVSTSLKNIKISQRMTRERKGKSTSQVPLSIQTSDSGWGCMIRSGQMLLAQALMVHLLGRNWCAFRKKRPIRTPGDHLHRQIIRWFYDSWSSEAPFSLHRLVKASGKVPGSWFGPATMCAALVKVISDASRRFEELTRIHIYWARDRVIYREEIMELARGHPVERKADRLNYTECSQNFSIKHDCPSNQATCDCEPTTKPHSSHAVILLLPIMLGPDKHVDLRYVPVVCNLIRDPCFIGLIGGRPKHSIYVLGCQNTQLIHLDPHFTQPTARNILTSDDFSVKSWHCTVPRMIEASKLDPCCAIGFYCRSRGELSDLLERLPHLMSVSIIKKDSRPVIQSLVEVKDED